jgi:hypothetical protein
VKAKAASAEVALVEELKWAGMRCRVRITGAGLNFSSDLRTKPADAMTSLLDEPRPVREGLASLVVPDDANEGNAAVVVVLDKDGRVVAQCATVVGGQ